MSAEYRGTGDRISSPNVVDRVPDLEALASALRRRREYERVWENPWYRNGHDDVPTLDQLKNLVEAMDRRRTYEAMWETPWNPPATPPLGQDPHPSVRPRD